MNRAIFQFSFFTKFSGIIDWTVLIATVLSPSLMLALGLANTSNMATKEWAARNLFASYSNSWLWMMYAYVLISDALVARRAVGDAAPLCLVFTRPLTRITYVTSKWLSGALGIFLLILPSALLFQLTCVVFGVNCISVDGYMIGEFAANSISYAALMVFLHCLPPGIGVVTYLTMIGITNIGNSLAAGNDKDANSFAHLLREILVFLSYWLGDFTYPTIDVYTALTSVTFDWNPVVIYLSNVVLYLVLATLCMVHREFFYATD